MGGVLFANCKDPLSLQASHRCSCVQNIEVLLESVMDAAEVLQRANEDDKVIMLFLACDAVPVRP